MTAENRIISIIVDPRDPEMDAYRVDVHATVVREHIAAHPTFRQEFRLRSEQWTVTHIPTGRSMCVVRDKPLAVAAAAAFARLPIDWGTTTAVTPKEWPQDVCQNAQSIRVMAECGDLQGLKAAFR
ncbi:hypothetical protein NB717_000074 [Xanthomonas sacchari]|uniref:hypothetical protein n=1 Tax=Xanthomonas sacchari TaxID=56458 RepID=UPI00225E1CAD|nr:hypothetical protein [Xanthomonas sacchari]MCW0459006.1 hypothetical protein [Xanthomonas sacchari]